MEHDFSSGNISSDDIDDFEEHHEHEPKIKQHKLEMIAFELFKMVHTSPHSNFAKNWQIIEKFFKTFLKNLLTKSSSGYIMYLELRK